MLTNQRIALLESIPSLPILRDSTISNRVFTDKSFLGKPHSSFEDDADVFPDNETFEHLGDAILGYCVTKLIRSVYPKLNPGGATIVRSRIVENRNLAAIAKAYHMDERLTVSTAQPSIKNHDRALARAIEAFVGGLHEEQGLAAVETWIRALFLPFVRTEYEILREELQVQGNAPPSYDGGKHQQCDARSETSSSSSTVMPPETLQARNEATVALAELNEKLIQMKIADRIRWSEDNLAPGQNPTFPIWKLVVRYNDDVVGEARATRKKEAKNLAAFAALRNLRVKGVLR